MKKLKDLSNDEALFAVKEYYANPDITVKDLCSILDIQYTSGFIKSIKVYTDDICENCGGKLRYFLDSRSYIHSLEENKVACEECGHTGDIETCTCVKCERMRRKRRKESEEKFKQKLKEKWKRSPISVEKLSLSEVIFLISLFKENAGSYISNIFESNNIVYFYREAERVSSLIGNLVDKGALAFDFDRSEEGAFKEQENGTLSYFITKACYYINVIEFKGLHYGDTKKLILERFNEDDVYELWAELSADEGLAYLDMRTNKLGLGIVSDFRDDLKMLIKDISSEYELGEVIYMLDYSARRATTFCIENNTEIRAAHKAILSWMRKAVEFKYVTSYQRPHGLDKPYIFSYFINEILGLNIEDEFKFRLKDLLLKEDKIIETPECLDNGKGVECVIDEFMALVDKITSLQEKGIPKSFIIKSLEITEEIFEAAVSYKVQ